MSRPDYVTQDHLDFLDELRESGKTNMFGAAPYIEKKFKVNNKESIKILTYWMETFGREDR